MYEQKTYTITEIGNKFLDWIDSFSLTQQLFAIGAVFYTLDKLSPKKEFYDIPITPKPKPVPRKYFSESTKRFTRFIQRYVCNSCKQSPRNWEYHHRDGNHSNNSPGNCEGLCLDCHAEKHRKKLF